MRIPLALAFLLAVTPAIADDAVRVAIELGMMLGSQEGCGFSFDPAAVNRYIEANVPADAMGFPGDLAVHSRVNTRRVAAMSEDTLSAHCFQVKRVARANGFID